MGLQFSFIFVLFAATSGLLIPPGLNIYETPTSKTEDKSYLQILSSVRSSGLIVQVVIPKTGTTAFKFSLGPLWQRLFNLDKNMNSSQLAPFPFMAGDCDHVRQDHMATCITGNKIFKCLNGRCHCHPPPNHITFTEIVNGYLAERGISYFTIPRNRVAIVTILRNPIDRVVSEYHHWIRGWCCSWMFSDDMIKNRINMTLSQFISHPDCPANNRQTWMLADLPFLRAADGRMITPSQYQQYFSIFYGAKNYADYLNQDKSLLNSAANFLNNANVVGLTERMSVNIALLLFSVAGVSRRGTFFESTSSGCFKLKVLEEVPLIVRHDRAVKYEEASPIDRELARQRNSLDLTVFKIAEERHQQLLLKNKICTEQSALNVHESKASG